MATWKSKYVDMRFIVSTSNICDRLLSITGYALNDLRKAVLPANIEMKLFLHANPPLWDLLNVHEILL